MSAIPCALLSAAIAASVGVMSCDSGRDPRKPPKPVTSSVPAPPQSPDGQVRDRQGSPQVRPK
ncbi:MAG: hypothetical protein ABIO45_12015 [Burkholderiaceae bacterium]